MSATHGGGAATKVRRLRTSAAAPTAGIYIRTYSERGGAGVGRTRQEQAARQLAEQLGWNVVDVYFDNDLTKHQPGRPEYERLVADIRAGRICAVVTWHVDSLVRKRAELETFLTLADGNDVMLATVDGAIDLGTPAGRAAALRAGIAARKNAEDRANDRIRRNSAAAARGQVWRTGTRCYGYTEDGLDVVPEEAEAIRNVVNRILQGESVRSIVMGLNEAGHRTSWGKDWHSTSLRRLILNPRISGRRVYRGKTTKGNWPAIITPQLQAQAAKALEERTRAHGRQQIRSPRRYFLTGGLLTCGLCGHALTSQPSGANKRAYVCRKGAGLPGCGRIRIIADPIEREVAERVLTRLASPAVRRRLAAAISRVGSTGEPAAMVLQRGESDLTILGRDYADHLIGRTEFLAARDRIQEHMDEAKSRLAAQAQLEQLPEPDPESLAEWWTEADLSRRRDLVALVLDHIVVGPATRRGPVGLDEDRLTWVWRTE